MSIEDRITEILGEHEYNGADVNPVERVEHCICDWHGDDHSAHVARVLVTELGLTAKEGFAPLQKRHLVRYTTKWMDA